MNRQKFRELMNLNIFPWLPSIPLPSIRTGGRKWRHFFLSHMSSYVDAGLSLTDSVEACIMDYPRRFRYPLGKIRQALEEGCTLSEALSRQSRMVFPKAYRIMIETGEKTGTLADVLKTLDRRQEDARTLKMKMTAAMIYPVLVVFISFMVTLFLMIKVMPTFNEIFADLGSALPAPSQALMDFSSFLMSSPWVLLLVPIGLFTVILFLGLRKRVDLFGRIFVRIPGVGGLVRHYDLLYFSSTMSLLLEAGITAREAVSLCGTEGMYPPLRDATAKMIGDIWEGKSFSAAVSEQKAFSPTFAWLVLVGEQGGTLAESFEALTEFERTRIERTLDIVRRFFQPSILILMGLGVGFIVVAMWLPILEISSLL